MIIKIDFGEDYIQYISCSTKVSRKINSIQKHFRKWRKIHPNYDVNSIIDWLNNVRFKKGIAKAKLITSPQFKVKKKLYY